MKTDAKVLPLLLLLFLLIHGMAAAAENPSKAALVRDLNQLALQSITDIKSELVAFGKEHPAFKDIEKSEISSKYMHCGFGYGYRMKEVHRDGGVQVPDIWVPENGGVDLEVEIGNPYFKTTMTKSYLISSPAFTENEFRGKFTAHALVEALKADGITLAFIVKEPIPDVDFLNKALDTNKPSLRFKDIALPEEANHLGNSGLALNTLQRFIIEAAYPDKCPKNRLILFNTDSAGIEAYYRLELGKDLKDLEAPVKKILEKHLERFCAQTEKLK